MKTLLYANRAEPKSISVISILLLAAAGDITKLSCMHRVHSVISLLHKIFVRTFRSYTDYIYSGYINY